MTDSDRPAGSAQAARTAILILTCSLSSAKRLENARAQAHDVFGQAPVRVVDGFIGRDPEIDRIYDTEKARRWCKRIPTRSEIAAYATHRLGWQTLLDSDFDHALLLEDDFYIRDPEIVRQAVDRAGELLAQGRHIVKLFDFPRDRSRNLGVWTRAGGMSLVKWQRTRAGLVGYLISREGAKRFLSRKRVFRVVDEDIKFFWELGLDIWSIPGNPICETAMVLGGSLLQEDRKRARGRNLMRSLKGIVLTLHRDWFTRYHFRRYRRLHRSTEST
ncbi:glycosyltransferase family 25 protein [Rhizobium sp. SGZ-381]|uniref:glycosyltransferase family 25 protein n=1 Tax=Rhizobium sp. SGZ-381 TaxID=3342800 RepID=UPI00366BD68C